MSGRGRRVTFTPKQRAEYFLAHEINGYPDGPVKDTLRQDLEQIIRTDARARTVQTPKGPRIEDPINKALQKTWGTMDVKNYIHNAPKGKISLTSSILGRRVSVSNYSNRENFEVGGAVDYKDVLDLQTKEPRLASKLSAAFIPVPGKPDIYQYKEGILNSDEIEELTKLAAVREFKEEIGIDISPSKLGASTRNYYGDNVFSVDLSPQEYNDTIVKPLDAKNDEELLTQSELSSKTYRKYLKYKAKYLNLKKQLEQKQNK